MREIVNVKNYNKLTQVVIFISWFTNIFASSLYDRVDPKLINCAIVLSITLGLFFLIFVLRLRIWNVNKYAFFLAVFAYGFAWFSSFDRYTEIVLFLSYALLVYLIGYNFPRLLYKQYLAVCYLIVIITIVDIVSYIALGSTMIGSPEIRHVSEFIPRISGFFDEPTDQAIFLGPALFYLLPNILSVNKNGAKSNRTSVILILMSYLFTFSVTAYFMLLVFILYYLIKNRKMSLVGLLVILTVISGIVFSGVSDMFTHKLRSTYDRNMYDADSATTAGTTIIALRDIITNTNAFDLILGVGYYNVYTLLPTYLKGSELEAYYASIGYFDENGFATNGIVHMLYAYGLLGISLIFYFLWRSFKCSRDKHLSIVIILTVILSMVKMSHMINDSTYIFLVFGLYWSSGLIPSDYIPMKSRVNIVDKRGYAHG